MTRFTFFSILSRVSLLKVSMTSADQDDVFVPFDAVQSVERVIKRVEKVGFRKPRHAQLVQRPPSAHSCPG